MEVGWTNESVDSIIGESLFELEDRVWRRSLQRLDVVAVSVDEVDAPKESHRASLSDRGMVVDEFLNFGFHDGLEPRGFSDQIFFEKVLDAFVGASQGYRVGLVGRAPAERRLFEKVFDGFAHADDGEREVGGAESFGGGDDVGNEALVVLEAPKLAGASESDHDFVGDVEDLVLVAERAHALHVALGRDEDAAGSDDGLEHDCGDLVGSFHQNLFFESCQGRLSGFLFVRSPPELERSRIEDLDEAGRSDFGEPPSEVTGGGERRGRPSVVRPVLGQDLVFAGVSTSNADGSFVGFVSAGREQESVDIFREQVRHELRGPAPNFGHSEASVDHRQRRQLFRDGIHHGLRNVVSQVGADRLARPVEVLLSVLVVQVHSLAAFQQRRVLDRFRVSPRPDDVIVLGLAQPFFAPRLVPVALIDLRQVDIVRLGLVESQRRSERVGNEQFVHDRLRATLRDLPRRRLAATTHEAANRHEAGGQNFHRPSLKPSGSALSENPLNTHGRRRRRRSVCRAAAGYSAA